MFVSLDSSLLLNEWWLFDDEFHEGFYMIYTVRMLTQE